MKKTIKFLIIFFVLIFSFTMVVSAQTQEKLAGRVDASNVTYPIAELGSCKDKGECARYCSLSENMDACLSYAEKNNMMSGEDLKMSKAVVKRINEGTTPGKCKNENECKAYCAGSVDHIKECVAFAREFNIAPEGELAEAEKILSALEGGAQMPGGCKTKGECENYCAETGHLDECLNFAEKSGILPPEELSQAKKVASFIKEGKTPGRCKNKDECDKYCGADGHFEECITFAETAGLVSKEDADIAKKAGGVGPSGCKTKAECEAFCNKEENIDVCTSFAQEKGLLSKEEQELVKNGIDQMLTALDSLPPDMKSQVESCLKDSIGEEKYQKIINKQEKPTKEIGGKIQACFAKLPKGKGGPGGEQGGMPDQEDINKMIEQGSIPKEVDDRYRNQMENRWAPSQGKVPENLPISIPENIPQGMPNALPIPAPNGGQGGEQGPSCAEFASIPSSQYCSMVPAGSARDKCFECKQ